jgi:hypothetical protein
MHTFTESKAVAGEPDVRRHQILIVANETVQSDVLERAVRSSVHAADGARVLVVAPALNSRIRHWTSDDDRAHELAEKRLVGCLERLGQAGIDANGIIGDADPLIAIGDALHVFHADELIIATHPETRSNWLARNVVARAQFRFGLPVLHVVVDRPGRSEYVVRSRSPARRRAHARNRRATLAAD